MYYYICFLLYPNYYYSGEFQFFCRFFIKITCSIITITGKKVFFVLFSITSFTGGKNTTIIKINKIFFPFYFCIVVIFISIISSNFLRNANINTFIVVLLLLRFFL